MVRCYVSTEKGLGRGNAPVKMTASQQKCSTVVFRSFAQFAQVRSSPGLTENDYQKYDFTLQADKHLLKLAFPSES